MLMSKLTLTLIRGLPGSGKSTLAKKIAENKDSAVIHLEADMFFVDSAGTYLFQPKLIKQAHQWCQQQCLQSLQKKQSVVVSNTFVKHWEMKFYQQLAKQYAAILVIKTCTGKYPNIHNVPATSILRMQQQWQK